ncbi:MAG: ABC transporter ATP-binding protein [bacterium]|nr:ABC transporter ATP-binding protein [bacterium]
MDPLLARSAAPRRAAPAAPLLEMRGITKRFPGVLANDAVDFDLAAGEVHTLLGENGAGKSTLMKILYGMYRPEAGEIRLRGNRVSIDSPSAAIEYGIGMIHQHFMLVPTLSVTENVALGLQSGRGPLTDLSTVANRIGALSDTYGLRVDPDALIWQLAVGERQRVEILKALYRDASILVMDEPTAVLTPQEVDELIVVLRRMAADGRGLVFISHKLHEVMAVSDRITVLRDGRVAGETTPAGTDRAELARMMVGRPVQMVPDRPDVSLGAPLLEVRDLHVEGDRGDAAVAGMSFSVAAGEILGLAGVSGNGQSELAQAIAGLRPPQRGAVGIDGADVTGQHPRRVRDAGLSYVPEERMRDGVIGRFTVAENLVLLNQGSPEFCRRGFLRLGAIRQHCRDLVERFAVKTPGIDVPTSNLSGGNIQKLILARELSARPKVILAAQPTRGVDVGAAEYIHGRLVAQKASGCATLLISEDLDEVLALSDRIGVMYEGRLMGVLDRAEATVERLGLWMAGVVEGDA